MELSLIHIFSVLAAAWLSGRIAQRFGLPAILGELAAGILLGPALLGWLGPNEATRVLAELGVYLLMLYIGLEMDPGAIARASGGGLLAAIGGFVIPFAAGMAMMEFFGYSTEAGLFMGTAMGVTSLATKSRILVDLDLIGTRIASVMMAGALFADTLALVVFAAILSLAAGGSISELAASDLALAFAKAALFFGISALVGMRALPILGRLIKGAGFRGRTSSFTIVLLVALVFAEMAKLAGLHSVLGAFIAGLFLQQGIISKRWSGEVRDVAHDISIGFLAPIFFVTAGFHVSPSALVDNAGLTILVIAVATVTKIAGTALFYLPTGRGWKEGLAVGAGMNGRGAVEIVMAELALSMGIINQEIFSVLVVMAFATTLTVPLLLNATVGILRRTGELARESDDRSGTVIVGANPLAGAYAECFRATGPVTIVDQNPAALDNLRAPGASKVVGNALNWDDLNRCDASTAGRLIVVVPNLAVAIAVSGFARREFGIADIYVPWSETTSGAFEHDFDRLKLKALATDIDSIKALGSGDEPVSTELNEFVVGGPESTDIATVLPGVSLPVAIETSGHLRPLTRNLKLRPSDLIWSLRLSAATSHKI